MIIEVDEYKKKVSGYDPERSEDFHRESAKLADRDFIESLKSKKYKRIVFMAGGTASGKTEFAHSYLQKKDQLVYDGTLKDFEGFKIKLQKIERYAKNKPGIKVVLVIPKDWIKAFGAFLKRERKMKPEIFFETQVKSKLTVARIFKETKIRVEVYISDVQVETNRLSYSRVAGWDRPSKARALASISRYFHKVAQDQGFEISVDYGSL